MFLFYFIDTTAIKCYNVATFVGNPTDEVRERLLRLHGVNATNEYHKEVEEAINWITYGYAEADVSERTTEQYEKRIKLIEERTGLGHTALTSFKPLNFAPNVTSSVFVSVFVWE
jgi:hypothetical protein